MTDYPPAEQPVSFRDPPVTEVAFALQFADAVIDLELLGEIAGSAKAEFPRREQHPPLPPMIEEFGMAPIMPQIIFQTAPMLPRTWFLSADGSRLIQVQSDRLGYNWRRDDLTRSYPRYDRLRNDLIRHVLPAANSVAASTSAAGINAVELSYVNQLRASGAGRRGPHPPLGLFLKVVASFRGDFLGEQEDARVQARWRIPGNSGEPIGRLYATAEPGFDRDETPIYLLTLTARILAAHADPPAAIALLDLAHSWIVRGFKDLTTDEMHATWGLERETS